MSGNMESLLMGGDSSSGESDDETNAPAPVAAAPKPAPAPMAAPVPAPSPAGGAADDMKARLKSLYSASKSGGGGGGASAAAPSARPSQPPPQQQQQQQQQPSPQPQQYQQPPPQQQRPSYQQPPQQQHQQQQQQQRHMQRSYPTHQQQPPPQQQQPQQHQQAPRASYPPPQQNRQSSQSMRPPPQRPPQQQQPPPQQHHMQRQHPQQQQQQQLQHPQQSHRSQQQHGQSSSSRADPFAPTPLAQIQHRTQGRMTHQPQQQPPTHQQPQQQQQPHAQQQQQRPMGSSASRSGAPGSTSAISEQEKRELLHRKQKEKFLMFTRVLIKYLESKDKALHLKAKLVIKDCAERNKRGERGYESVTMAMQRRLKDLVGETYWKKAQEFLYYMHQKRKERGAGGGSGSVSQPPGGGSSTGQSLSQQPTQQLTNEQKRQYIEQKRKQQAAAVAKAKGTTALDKVRDEIHQKREQIAMQTSPQPGRPTTTEATGDKPAPSTPLPTATKGKKPTRRKSDGSTKTQSRKAAASNKAAATATAASTAAPPAPAPTKVMVPIPKPIIVEPPREYEELMNLIDHAVDYDWPSIGQLLGSEKDLNLSEEERQLLYGDASPMPLTATTATVDSSGATESEPADAQQPSEDQSPDTLPRPGWGSKNVLTVRGAWAVVRLPEQKRKAARGSAPTVAGGLLTLPSDPSKTTDASSSTPSDSTSLAEGPWVNEATAEKDAALALLSEGFQIFLKGVLEKGIQCARQRQNLDGIRLWHQQYAAYKDDEPKPVENAGKGENAESTEDKTKNENKPKRKPPLLLRLGCDVSRQVARAQGNAAMTVKRMEEALERQPDVPSAARILNPDTLSEATSMSDLSWRPLLKEGSKKADYEAKRSFEIYGGKESKDPPLGRVPKKAKLVVSDFHTGSELSREGNRQRASSASMFIQF